MQKKVELPELFFDLVYVYAIGQSMEILKEGGFSFISFTTFSLTFLFLMNIWVLQTIFTNRFGKNSGKNQFFLFLDMALLLLLSNAFGLEWQGNFTPYLMTVLALTISLHFQYLLEIRHSSLIDRLVIKTYLLILGSRAILVLASLVLPLRFGLPFYLAGLIFPFLLPLFFRKWLRLSPIDFGHLLERLMLLSIVTFGEMIMGGLAHLFTFEHLSLTSVFLFNMVVMLFLFYYEEFSFDIKENWQQTTGLKMVYWHYVIYLSLAFATYFLEELSHEISLTVLVGLFLALACYYLAILQHGSYNKCAYRFKKSFWWQVFIIWLLAFSSAIFFRQERGAVLLGISIYTSVMTLAMKQMRRFKQSYWR